MNFGQYKESHMTYQDLWGTDREYAQWAIQTMETEEVTGPLKKMATWFTQAECLETEALAEQQMDTEEGLPETTSEQSENFNLL